MYFHRTDRERSLEDLYFVTKDLTGNWSLSLRSQPPLRRDENRVIEIPHRPVKASEFDVQARLENLAPDFGHRWGRDGTLGINVISDLLSTNTKQESRTQSSE